MTHHDRAYWERLAARRIDADERAGGTAALLRQNLRITEAYAEMYLRRPTIYRWAGMAALASATVGRGMHVMLGLRHTGLSLLIGLWPGEAATIFARLAAGNRMVFDDIYWQHLAYERGGLAAIESAGGVAGQSVAGWRMIDAGRQAGDSSLVWEGNRLLLEYEQRFVLQPGVYDEDPALWESVAGWIPSPIPGQYETFASFAAGGSVGEFSERWGWIEGRMLRGWQDLTAGSEARVERRLTRYIAAAAGIAAPQRGVLGWLRLAPALGVVV